MSATAWTVLVVASICYVGGLVWAVYQIRRRAQRVEEVERRLDARASKAA